MAEHFEEKFDFYMYLSSLDSFHRYPNNKPFNFTCHMHKPFYLKEGEWEMALVEILFQFGGLSAVSARSASAEDGAGSGSGGGNSDHPSEAPLSSSNGRVSPASSDSASSHLSDTPSTESPQPLLVHASHVVSDEEGTAQSGRPVFRLVPVDSTIDLPNQKQIKFKNNRKFRSVADMFYELRRQIDDEQIAMDAFNSIDSKFREEAMNDMPSFDHTVAPITTVPLHELVIDENTIISFAPNHFTSFLDLYTSIKARSTEYATLLTLYTKWAYLGSAYDGRVSANTFVYNETLQLSVKFPQMIDIPFESFAQTLADAVPYEKGERDAVMTAVEIAVRDISSSQRIAVALEKHAIRGVQGVGLNTIYIMSKNNVKLTVSFPVHQYTCLNLVMTIRAAILAMGDGVCDEFVREWNRILLREKEHLVRLKAPPFTPLHLVALATAPIAHRRKRRRRSVTNVNLEVHRLIGTFVFCDILCDQWVGNEAYPVLSYYEECLDLRRRTAGTVVRGQSQGKQLRYISVKKKLFNSITFSLAERKVSYGTNIWIEPTVRTKSDPTSTQISLHFRKKIG